MEQACGFVSATNFLESFIYDVKHFHILRSIILGTLLRSIVQSFGYRTVPNLVSKFYKFVENTEREH
jgi:hypothetical protein